MRPNPSLAKGYRSSRTQHNSRTAKAKEPFQSPSATNARTCKLSVSITVPLALLLLTSRRAQTFEKSHLQTRLWLQFHPARRYSCCLPFLSQAGPGTFVQTVFAFSRNESPSSCVQRCSQPGGADSLFCTCVPAQPEKPATTATIRKRHR